MSVMAFVVDGCQVDVDIATLTGLEWRDAKRATGLRQVALLADAVAGDFDAQAALVWLRLRRESDEITYEQVLERFSYATVGGPVTVTDEEASGGG